MGEIRIPSPRTHGIPPGNHWTVAGQRTKQYHGLRGSREPRYEISTMVDREKRNRVCSALKQTLGNLTDIGRKEKLVHILHQMGIREIKNCGTEFEIDDKTIGKLISLRNKCYHGDRKKADHSYMNIDLAVTQLMYLCEQIIIKQMKSTHERMV